MAETDVVETVETETVAEEVVEEDTTKEAENAEIARLKAELTKQINKNDALAKENAGYKKTIRASKSAEEQRAEEERERQETIERELNELRKRAAVSGIAKTVMGFVGDETTSNSIAEALYGAEDVDAAMDAISKAWTLREKKLRMEYGKIPAPDAGDGAPTTTKQELSEMTYLERLDFANKYPDTYEKLMK